MGQNLEFEALSDEPLREVVKGERRYIIYDVVFNDFSTIQTYVQCESSV